MQTGKFIIKDDNVTFTIDNVPVSTSNKLGLKDFGRKELFECTYGTTTYAEITSALSDGKIPYFIYNGREYLYQVTRNDGAYFFGCFDSSSLTLYVGYITSNDSWSNTSYIVENTGNKVTSISSSSTDTEYPSAKCVYDELEDKQDILVNQENIKSINGNSLLGTGNLEIDTNQAFPTSWDPYTTSSYTTKQFCDIVNADSIAIAGKSYLGEVRFSDLPSTLVNGEIIVEIMYGSGTSDKVIHLMLSSGNVAPYRWEYTYWNNGSNVSGWIGFQTEITSSSKLSSDLVDDVNHTNKFVTASEKTTWNNKQDALPTIVNNKYLHSDNSGGLEWADAMSNPMTTSQDIIIAGNSGTPTRLAKGNNNELLGVNSSGNLAYTKNLPYLTTAPVADNTGGGVIKVYLPESVESTTTFYEGYEYNFYREVTE